MCIRDSDSLGHRNTPETITSYSYDSAGRKVATRRDVSQISTVRDASGTVSYTHLDVYKRQMVGINATNQGYAMVQPWSKENPAYSQGFGIYLGDGNILTAANIVYSAT